MTFYCRKLISNIKISNFVDFFHTRHLLMNQQNFILIIFLHLLKLIHTFLVLKWRHNQLTLCRVGRLSQGHEYRYFYIFAVFMIILLILLYATQSVICVTFLKLFLSEPSKSIITTQKKMFVIWNYFRMTKSLPHRWTESRYPW